MTVAELIQELEQYDGDTPVRLATQPNYPLEYTIDCVNEIEDDDGKLVVYIAEGSQIGYGTRRAWGGW